MKSSVFSCHDECHLICSRLHCGWSLNTCFLHLYPQLIFSLARYEAVIDAYLDGLEASGLNDLSRVTSVASFFVSRVDTLIDKMLEKIGTREALNLRGKVITYLMPIFSF